MIKKSPVLKHTYEEFQVSSCATKRFQLQLQVLTLIELSITKFLSPDLALLMETGAGSTLNEIGQMIKSYLQHDDWAIRDSALQLVHSCTDVAYISNILTVEIVTGNLCLGIAHLIKQKQSNYNRI